MLDQLMYRLKEQESLLGNHQHLFKEISIASKTTLVKEGETSQNIYFVKEGCLRLWFNNQGKDVTFQFFFENQAVSCFLGREPSKFNLESIEPTKISVLRKNDFYILLEAIPEIKDGLIEILFLCNCAYLL